MGAAISRNGRGGNAASRLREALSELNRRLASGGAAAAPTAKALCDLAGVSRNALYRYHPAVLYELHKLQRRRHREPSPARQDLQRLRNENEDLRSRLAKLAALVDHYFAAWQEASKHTARGGPALAEYRSKLPSKVVGIRGQTVCGNR